MNILSSRESDTSERNEYVNVFMEVGYGFQRLQVYKHSCPIQKLQQWDYSTLLEEQSKEEQVVISQIFQ